MGKEDRPALTGDAQTNDLRRYEAVHHASASGISGSPQALETTLASISTEVTAEALERLAHAARLKQQRAKTGT
jgi:hypothetical protein